MSNVPVPPHLPGPYDSDEDFEPVLPSVWNEEIDWGRRGQFGPLVRSLRAGKKIGEADGELYNFLADVLDGKFKKPRNRPPKYERAFPFGQIGPRFPNDLCRIKERYRQLCEQAAFVWQHKADAQGKGMAAGKALSDAIERAQKKFRLTDKQQDKLEVWLSRSTNERRRLAALK